MREVVIRQDIKSGRIPAGRRGLVFAFVRRYRGMLTCNKLERLSHKFIIVRHSESFGLGYF